MRTHSNQRVFDLSTTFVLGLIALLLVSLPGGCWDREDDEADDVEEPVVQDSGQPTPPPMMEIVEPDPDGIDIPPPQENDDGPAPPPPAQVEQPDDGTYIVQPGDTLHGIAVRFSVGVDELQDANGITDPNSLQVGQILRIPGRD